MKLKFIDVDLNPKKPRATIHLSGKLGFNKDAAEMMDLPKMQFVKIAKDEEGDELYLLPVKTGDKAAKVAKAGSYYYLSTGNAFELLDIDYTKNSITYNISKENYEGSDIYKLTIYSKTERTGDEKEE